MRKVNQPQKHYKCARGTYLSHIFFYSKIKEAIIITCRYITYEDRKRLEQLYSAGAAISDIAVTLNIHISTAYREIAKGNTGTLDKNGRFGYDAEIAQKATQESLKRRGGKRTKKKSENKNGD